MATDREQRTLEAMIDIYCRAHHDAAGRCQQCQDLLDYAQTRLNKCPFQPDKPTCAKCPVHCYQPAKRQLIREVMQFAGPRMVWQHPTLAVQHLWQGRRAAPKKNTQ